MRYAIELLYGPNLEQLDETVVAEQGRRVAIALKCEATYGPWLGE
jgi:hypothetical protein